MPVEIKWCNCTSKFQDERYGKQMRVHNSTTKAGGSGGGIRCSVCGKVKPA